jgi:hypothetical protein
LLILLSNLTLGPCSPFLFCLLRSPPLSKVYRGLGKLLLPTQFWVPHGTPEWRGGVERAFMSTTTDKSVALFYANGRGTVLEVSVGRIQNGGDISFLSMVSSPHTLFDQIMTFLQQFHVALCYLHHWVYNVRMS